LGRTKTPTVKQTEQKIISFLKELTPLLGLNQKEIESEDIDKLIHLAEDYIIQISSTNEDLLI
jgi:hypothetical protein